MLQRKLMKQREVNIRSMKMIKVVGEIRAGKACVVTLCYSPLLTLSFLSEERFPCPPGVAACLTYHFLFAHTLSSLYLQFSARLLFTPT